MKTNERDFDVDIVVLWVDGNDPEWLAEKEKYAVQCGLNTANQVNRFRDWGLMNYWFRGIDTFAPWVRKVHFVTWGHLPPFLNTQSSKLHIVNHRDFMPHDALPTYNSEALELNMHRIDGLAERFIYFNDDMMLIRPVTKEQFFDAKTGLPRLEFTEMPIRATGCFNAWEVSQLNDIGVINHNFKKRNVSLRQYFGKYVSTKYPLRNNLRSLSSKLMFPEYYTGFKSYHSIAPFLKSTFVDVWKAEAKLLQRTTYQRFRESASVNQWLPLFWQFASGDFMPKKNAHITFNGNEEALNRIVDTILMQKWESICINDPEEDIDFEKCRMQIEQAFHSILPAKSREFER